MYCIIDKEDTGIVGMYTVTLQDTTGYTFTTPWCDTCHYCNAGLDWRGDRCFNCRDEKRVRENLDTTPVPDVYGCGSRLWYPYCKVCKHGEIQHKQWSFSRSVGYQCSHCKEYYHKRVSQLYPTKYTVKGVSKYTVVWLYDKPEEKHSPGQGFKWVKRKKGDNRVGYLEASSANSYSIHKYALLPTGKEQLWSTDVNSIEKAQELIVQDNGGKIPVDHWL